MARFVYRPLGLIPFIPDLLAATAVSLAELSSKTPLRNNRALARFYSGARATAYWSALRRRGWPLNSTLLALCYHAVQDRKDDPVLAPYSVPSELFTEQLDALLRRGYTFITPDQFAAFLFADAPVPRRAALLTFDDGYADLVGPARDALTQRGIRPLVFCVTGFSTNGWDRASGAGTLELLNGNQMREIASAGAEIGSHSRTHRVMLHLEPHELRAEVEGSADEIVRHGLPRPRFFAYPYGARNAAAINAVADAGYLAAFGPNHARMRRSSPLFDLPRVHILASDRGWRFRAKTRFPATYAFVARKVSAVTSRIAKVTASAPHGR
jgi:peptidoglycan/xylan/chitin deacetylase (PgdA/CDA1 family)